MYENQTVDRDTWLVPQARLRDDINRKAIAKHSAESRTVKDKTSHEAKSKQLPKPFNKSPKVNKYLVK